MAANEDQLLQQGLDHHAAGRLDEARGSYEELLRISPDHSEALYLLGVIAYQGGRPEQTVELSRRALAIAPEARCYHLLGLALLAQGNTDEAEAALRCAAALEPSATHHNSLGAFLREQGRLNEAIAAFQQALTGDPGYGAALYNLGCAKRESGDLEAAAHCFRGVVEIDPEHANAAADLGQALKALGRTGEAVTFLRKAVALKPGNAGWYCDLGDALQSAGQYKEASTAYQTALGLDPNLSSAWYSAGCAASSLGEYAAAAGCFERGLGIRPQWPEAQHNLGQALFKLGQVDAALDLFRLAASGGDPGLPLAAIAVLIPGSPSSDNEAILEARRAFAERQQPRSARAGSRHRLAERGGRPARVGYVSAFFQDHNWMKPVWGLINHHDRERFQVHLFSDAPASKIEHGYDRDPRDVVHETAGLSNQALAQRIEETGIDLLIDLNGYSALGRLPLFTMHPAAVVAGWFNLYATTGIAGYDYLIGDEVVIPAEEEKFYCERIVRVPGSYLTFEVTYPVPAVAGAPCLASGAITFGSLASQYKITDEVAGAWSRILQQVPGSSLLLKNSGLASSGTRRFVREVFERHEISADRLRLEGPSDHFRFLETYGKIDVALDTFPYNGGTTTTEAIWQGVPVVTFRGDRWVSRTSASILEAGGLSELVADGVESYASLAVTLAQSPERLVELRRGMRARLQDSPVCDTERFAREMEKLYVHMLENEAFVGLAAKPQ